MWFRKNWFTFSYLYSFCGSCTRWLYASASTCNLGFSKFLQELRHFCQILLHFIPVVHCMVKFLCEEILYHSGNHLTIIFCDCVFWWCSLCLWFLVCASCLCGWSLISPWFMCVGIWGSLLFSLNLFLLFLGRLCILLLPLLGPYPLWPFVCLFWLALARSWFNGYLDL